MALEELCGARIDGGAIFYASSKRRRLVTFDAALREKTERAAERLREMMGAREIPPAVFDARCRHCSLKPACQPELSPLALRDALRKALE